MVYLKTALKVTLVSAMLVAGSITTAQANHNDHSILPYVALGVFAGILHQNSHSHTYYHYKKKRRHGHNSHYGHSSHYGNSGHYSSGYQRSHSHGGYHYKKKRH